MNSCATESILPPPPEPSQFSEKINTNYIPSSSEISSLRSYLTSLSDSILTYDDQIASLESQLRALTLERSFLQSTFSSHQALISPFRRLPPEILQHIFVWCLPQSRNCVMHASEAPLLLGRVCSSWRRISLSTNELWAKLHIVPPTVNYLNPIASLPAFRRKKDLITLWLGRSGTCPLSISMIWLGGETIAEVKVCGMLLDVIKPLSRRWKNIDLQVPFNILAPFKELRPKDVPLLESISFLDNRAPIDRDSRIQWPVNLGFATTALSPAEADEQPPLSSLRSFSLTYFTGSICLPTLPLSQLTTLYLDSHVIFFFLDAPAMLETLRKCVSLIELTLKFPLSQPHFSPVANNLGGSEAALPNYASTYKAMQELKSTNDGLVRLEHLEVLKIFGDQHMDTTFHMSNILEFVVVPKLRTLEILGRNDSRHQFGYPNEDWIDDSNVVEDTMAPVPLDPVSSIFVLLQQSGCPPLERLSLESIGFLHPIDPASVPPDLALHNSYEEGIHISPLLRPQDRPQLHSAAASPLIFIACLRLIPTLKELLVLNWTTDHHHHHSYIPQYNDIDVLFPIMDGTSDGNIDHLDDVHEHDTALDELNMRSASAERGKRVKIFAEDILLKALTVRQPKDILCTDHDTAADTDTGGEHEIGGVDSNSEILCPKLESVDFILNSASQHLLGAFIASRCQPPSSLQTLLKEPINSSPCPVARLKYLKVRINASESDPASIELEALIDKYTPRFKRLTFDGHVTTYDGYISRSQNHSWRPVAERSEQDSWAQDEDEAEGLIAVISYEPLTGCCDDVEPSPWAGLTDQLAH